MSIIKIFKFDIKSISNNIINIYLNKYKIIKLNLIFGTNGLYFSLSSLYLPFTGLFLNPYYIFNIFIVKVIYILLFSKVNFLSLTLLYLPGFASSLYLSTNSKLYKLFIPILSMILFINNPIFFSVKSYSLYWLIPIFVSIFNIKSIFLRSLAATFVAHAVGTMISIYSGQLSCNLINQIKLIIFFEKILFAALMSISYYLVCSLNVYIKEKLKNLNYKFINKIILDVK